MVNFCGDCSSLIAHLSVVAESWVRIPAPCKYCKAGSAAATTAVMVAATTAVMVATTTADMVAATTAVMIAASTAPAPAKAAAPAAEEEAEAAKREKATHTKFRMPSIIVLVSEGSERVKKFFSGG